ncbi:hypothetical protein HOLleu_03829 [Holothuria leucospilota]|uniref:NACHT domain-containing protein n=1 Tax=Holothuria leucospilota TaxID=206669 RepID=A0A9Q1CSI1_HOLLE|nr:hypothetical protein HOLleu_03829 [Holothuria leucospilota]
MDTTCIQYVLLCIWASSIKSATNGEGCKSPQYLQIGKPGIINCSLEHETYVKIEWYHSTVIDQPIASYNGSYSHVAVPSSNEYDIHPDGSLRIRNVSSKHVNNFTVIAYDESKDKPITYVVSVFATADNADKEGAPDGSYTSTKSITLVVIAALIPVTLMVICAVILIHKRVNLRSDNDPRVGGDEENIPMFPNADVAGVASCTDISQAAKMKTLRKYLQNEYTQLYETARQQENILQEYPCLDEIYIDSPMQLFVVGEGLRGYGRWKRIDSRHDVFDKFLRGKNFQPSACIVDGDFGFGKSFLALQLTHDWCSSNPMSPLNNFELLILLRMGQLQRPFSIAAAIKQLIVPEYDGLTENDIDEVLNATESCLVILDGFEQYPCRNIDNESEIIKLSRSEIRQSFKVIVTTRFHTAVKHDVNAVRVRMEGFDEKARGDYISQLFSKGKEQVSENLKLCLEEYPDLCQLCEAPLFFFALVKSFYKGKVQSITDIVGNIVSRFYSHNQSERKNDTLSDQNMFESSYHYLRKIAFHGLTKLETINWEKVKIHPQVGDEFYDHLVSIGILVEWQVIDYTKDLSDSRMHYMKMVRFYNRIICQWYAAQYIRDVFLQEANEEFTTCLNRLRVRDISIVLRFICGQEHSVIGAVTQYLKTRKGFNHLPVMCVMEQCGDLDVKENTIRELCASSTEFKSTDTVYQQKISLHFLNIASKQEVSIARVVLKNCFGTVNLLEKCIILTTGERLPSATNVCDLVIVEEERTLTVQETLDVIWFANECKYLETLRFQVHLLPETLQLDISQPSNIEILWSPKSEPLLVLEKDSSQWEVKDVAHEDIKREVPQETPTMDGFDTSNDTDLVLYAH